MHHRHRCRSAAPTLILALGLLLTTAPLTAQASTRLAPAASTPQAAPATSATGPAATTAAAATTAQAAAKTGQGGEANPAPLPQEFRTIKLGMSIEEVQKLLQQDLEFDYRGPEDVSLLPTRNQSLVEATGRGFVRRAFFQFLDGKLWTIIVFLNPAKLDHYSVYTSLVAKYGEPLALDPKEVRWEDKSTRMSLERPLTLRYMDMKAFSEIEAGGEAKAGIEQIDRQDFLGGL